MARGPRAGVRADPVRAFFRALFSVVLRIFFRRIEVSGLEHVPAQGPVLFVLNHPNGLVDPAFLLCLAPRRVSLLAKAPLFRMPVIGSFCRAFDAIPVHRRQDEGFDPAQNRETFETARTVLAREGAIAIFPEGASHSDPQLRPLRTGAARIALGAAAMLAGPTPLRIVPAGLYYRAKRTFRSAALLHFAEPLLVAPVRLASGEEPPAGPVRELTAQIERALAEVTLQAEQTEVHALVERAQRIFTAQDDPPETPPTLREEFDLRRRFLAGYRVARIHWPDRFTALAQRIDRYERATGLRMAAGRALRRRGACVAASAASRDARRRGHALSRLPGRRLRRDWIGAGRRRCASEHQGAGSDAAVPAHLGRHRAGNVALARRGSGVVDGGVATASGLRRPRVCRAARPAHRGCEGARLVPV